MIGHRVQQARAARANGSFNEVFGTFGTLPWKVMLGRKIVALFFYERDARGFAAARYKDHPCVCVRKRA